MRVMVGPTRCCSDRYSFMPRTRPGVGIAANATDEQQAFAPRIRGGSAH